MEFETEANPVADEEVLTSEGAEAEAETGEIDNDEAQAPETVEIEFDGKKFTVPKELEGQFLMQQDYTKKTMTLAEERKATEAEIAQQRETLKLREANIDLHATIKDLSAKREEFVAFGQTAEWQQLRTSNPVEADRIEREFDRIERALFKAQNDATTLQGQLSQQEERMVATFQEKQMAEAARLVKDFPARKPELEKLATELGGYTADQLKLATANDFRLLDLAAEGLKARKAQEAAAKQKTAAAVQPAVEAVKGRTPTAKPMDDRASTEAWMKARNEQLRRN